jgi:hypothetical protein
MALTTAATKMTTEIINGSQSKWHIHALQLPLLILLLLISPFERVVTSVNK